jgi:lipopolysaccharide export system permease protein
MCTSVIIWVFQAVNFLDIIVEDGRDFWVYLNYTLLNFPKIISKIVPFAVFFSFCYIINKYELNNELIIFWNFGIHKFELVHLFFKFSILIMLIQIILTSIIVPTTQNYSRSIIRNSSVDFFESFVKPKKFNDNIRGLTIYAESKDENGDLKNIYLKKDSGDKKYQITVAKTGKFKTINGSKFLVLYNGQTINLINKKVTNFNFSKSDFTLSQLDSDVIIQDKIQETSTLKMITCLKNYFKKDLSEIRNAPAYLSTNCTQKNLDNIFQELYKRFIIPLYIPVLILTSLLLILNSKENLSYNKYKTLIFASGLLLIIFSESSLKFVQDNFYGNVKILIVPFLGLISLYLLFNIKLIHKIER